MRVTRSGRGRGTRRSRAGACSWCQSMGARAPPRCTWKARGPQDKFVSPACVRDACFGHMVASVWSGSRVRRQNKDRLKGFLSNSVEELAGSGEEPAQHAWAAALLDACKLEELRCCRLHSSSESDSSDSGGGGECSGDNDAVETFRDWGTPYANVDRLLGGPGRGITPGALKAEGRSCRWCSHEPAVGECVCVVHNGVSYRGTVVSFPSGASGSRGAWVVVRLQHGEVRVRRSAISVPGSRSKCTAWSGVAPVEYGLENVCMGHLVAFVSGLPQGRTGTARVGHALASSRLAALVGELDKCCDHGGVPSGERVWVSHIAAAVKYERLLHTSRVAATSRERDRARASATWFKQWGTVFSGVGELLQNSRCLVFAGEHKVQWVAEPAACGHCGAWGVKASSKVVGGKRHFGRECCGQGSIASAAAPPSGSHGSSGSESMGSGSSGDNAHVSHATMPINLLDDWMLDAVAI